MNFLKRWINGLPSRRFLREATSEVITTPDRYRLERSKYNLLLEYGELQDGLPSHDLITRHPLCHAFTVETFSLWKKNDIIIPTAIALKLNFEDPRIAMIAHKIKIRGELYKCTTADLIELDKYRHEGVQFERRRINIVLPILDKDFEPKRANAWVYVGKREFWEKPLKQDLEFSKVHRGGFTGEFSPVSSYDDQRRPWIGRYYHFTPNEFMRPHEIGENIKTNK
jgi:gamma-glutamylcyclotransferase (GGCT)/AIG2-like uncharacterized protein YtfP